MKLAAVVLVLAVLSSATADACRGTMYCQTFKDGTTLCTCIGG